MIGYNLDKIIIKNTASEFPSVGNKNFLYFAISTKTIHAWDVSLNVYKIIASPTSGSGGATWSLITGDITAQLDLQTQFQSLGDNSTIEYDTISKKYRLKDDGILDKHISPKATIAKNWSATDEYNIGDVTIKFGQIFISNIDNNINSIPSKANTDWTLTPDSGFSQSRTIKFNEDVNTALSVDLTDTATEVIVDDNSGFPSSGWIALSKDGVLEVITYTGKSVDNKVFTGCIRGASGTIPNSYNIGEIVFTNFFSTTLSANIDATVNTIPANTTGMPKFGRIQIDNEYMYYSTTDANNFIQVRRGQDGSTATSHTAGATISTHPTYLTAVDSDITVDLDTVSGETGTLWIQDTNYIAPKPGLAYTITIHKKSSSAKVLRIQCLDFNSKFNDSNKTSTEASTGDSYIKLTFKGDNPTLIFVE